MVKTYEQIRVEGEQLTVSLIVWRRFMKRMPGLVEEVYSTNPNLADLGIFLPLGTKLFLPIPAPKTTPIVKVISLWD